MRIAGVQTGDGGAILPDVTTTEIAPAPVRRGRGPWFGAILTAGVTLLVAGGVVLGMGAAGLTPVLTWRSARDSGVQACVTMRDAHAAGRTLGAAEDARVNAQLAASRNPHLRRAGEAFARYAALPAGQSPSLGEIAGALGDIGAGCTAVGVALPVDMFTVTL